MTAPENIHSEKASAHGGDGGLRNHVQHLLKWISENSWTVAGLIIATLITYFPVLWFEFVNWDDPWYILNNDLIKSWHPANLYGIATEPVARNFAPLTIFTFLVDHTLWGLWSGGYHLTNVLLHAMNALLVYALVKRLSKNTLVAWTLGLIFALHPVQVETVAWVSSRKTLLSATFMLASSMCWLRTDRTANHVKWGIIWLILGLLSKAATVVIPPIVVAYDVLIARKKFSESLAHQVAPMFLSVMLILVTMTAQTTIVGGVRDHIGASKLWIIAIDSTILWRYVAMSLFPTELCVLYDPATTGIALWIGLALVSWSVIGLIAYRFHKRYPMPVFCLACWLLLLFPVLNFFPITTLMNDRYLYLPLVPFFGGLFAIGSIGWERLQSSHLRQWFAPAQETALRIVLCTVMIGVYCFGTQSYLPVWSGPVPLWSYARQTTPSLPVIHIQWAITLKDQGANELAIKTLKRALKMNPDEGDRKRIEAKIDEWSTEQNHRNSA